MEETKVGVIYKEIIEGIKVLPLEQQAKIYNAIFEYQFTGQIVDDDMFVKSFILSHKTNFDNMKSRREINTENGKKGGCPKGSHNNPYGRKGKKELTETNRELTETNPNKPITNLKQEARSKKQEVKSKNQEEINKKESLKEKSAKGTTTQNKFVKPTKEDLKDFATKEQLRTDLIDEFIDHYESIGWRVGKAGLPMRSWEASYRGWCRRQKDIPRNKSSSNEFLEMLKKEYPEEVGNIFPDNVVDVEGAEQ